MINVNSESLAFSSVGAFLFDVIHIIPRTVFFKNKKKEEEEREMTM